MPMKIGYIRVSTQEQNTVRQEDLMERLGVELVYMDKLSGKARDRPALQTMMDFVRAGDTVVVESISRFARNTRDLLELIEQLREKGVEFQSQKEAIDTTTPSGKFMLTVFGAVAELEREYILQRQREGICRGPAMAGGRDHGHRSHEAAGHEVQYILSESAERGDLNALEAVRCSIGLCHYAGHS